MITETNMVVFFLGVVLMGAGFTHKIQVPLPGLAKPLVGTVGGVVTVLAVLSMLA
jgi:hypothetical protein